MLELIQDYLNHFAYKNVQNVKNVQNLYQENIQNIYQEN